MLGRSLASRMTVRDFLSSPLRCFQRRGSMLRTSPQYVPLGAGVSKKAFCSLVPAACCQAAPSRGHCSRPVSSMPHWNFYRTRSIHHSPLGSVGPVPGWFFVMNPLPDFVPALSMTIERPLPFQDGLNPVRIVAFRPIRRRKTHLMNRQISFSLPSDLSPYGNRPSDHRSRSATFHSVPLFREPLGTKAIMRRKILCVKYKIRVDNRFPQHSFRENSFT